MVASGLVWRLWRSACQYQDTLSFAADPRREALQLIRSADVGVIPHIECELTESTLPNKLYDYFAAGLPVIASSTGPLRRELQLANAGFAISNSPAAWGNAIARLQESPLLAAALGMNGFRFAAQHRTWESNLSTLRTVFGPQE
jgi:glycosyltransferase involved in cell wall biosynthesis